jgi:transaldolase
VASEVYVKFFLDTANLDEIRRGIAWGIIDGVTTNPTLIAKEGVPVEDQVRKIADIVNGDISAEVVSTNSKDMIEEGRRLAKIHRNVVVKIPLIPEGIVAVSALKTEGIRTNVTLCFSAAQALVAAKAGAYIISPFIGRIDDIGWPGMDLISEIVTIYNNYGYKTQVLAASIRGPLHVIQAAKAGAHIATLPFKVLEQLFHHPLTDKGLDQFLTDYRKAFELVTA